MTRTFWYRVSLDLTLRKYVELTCLEISGFIDTRLTVIHGEI